MTNRSYLLLYLKRSLRILIWTIVALIFMGLLCSLLLFIPSVQKFAVDQATTYLQTKTNMPMRIGSIHIAFPKTIEIGGVFLEDHHGDTLVYCDRLGINAAILPLAKQKFTVDYLLIDGLQANILKIDGDSLFNFTPLIEAFSGKDKQNRERKKKSKWDLAFNTLDLNHVSLRYTDLMDSSLISLELGELQIEARPSNVFLNKFDLKKINLSNAVMSMTIGNGVKRDHHNYKKNEAQAIPEVKSLEELNLEDIALDLQLTKEKLSITTRLQEARIKPNMLDFPAQKIVINDVLINGLDIALQTGPTDKVKVSRRAMEPNGAQLSSGPAFGSFEWDVFVHRIGLNNSLCRIDMNGTPRMASGIDYRYLDFSDLNVGVDSLHFNKNSARGTITSLTLKEISGPEVEDLSGVFSMNNHEIIAEKVDLRTGLSHINGSVRLNYPAPALIGARVGELGIKSNLQGNIQTSEIRAFTDFMDSWQFLDGIENITVHKFTTEGTLNDLKLPETDIAILGSTRLKTHCEISELLSGNISLNYAINEFSTCKKDLIQLLPDTLTLRSIELPQKIALTSRGNTNFTDGYFSGEIVSEVGQANFDVELDGEKISADLAIAGFDLGTILDDSIYGKMDLTTQFKGKFVHNSLEGFTSKTNISSMDFGANTFQNILVSVTQKHDTYAIDADISCPSIEASLRGTLSKKEPFYKCHANLEVLKSDLQTLHISNGNLSVSGDMAFDMEIKSLDEFRGVMEIGDLDLINERSNFHINTLRFQSDINKNYTNFNLTSDILDANLSGNTKITELNDALIDHLDRYIALPDSLISEKDFYFEFDLQLKRPDFFTEFLFEDLEALQLERCHARYKDKTDILEAEIVFPKVNYNGMSFENLALIVDSKSDSTLANISVRSISYDSVLVRNVDLRSVFTRQQADILLNIHDAENRLKYQFASRVSYEDSSYYLSIDPEHTIIHYAKWAVPPENLLHFRNGNFTVESTSLLLEDQKLWLESLDKGLKLRIQNFRIENLTRIVEHGLAESAIEGRINGYIEARNILSAPEINSELNIPDLIFKNEPLGSLNANIGYSKIAPFSFNIRLQNEMNSIYMAGTSVPKKKRQKFNVILEADIKNANSFQPLLSNVVKDLHGGISGRLSVSGDAKSPELNGNFNFRDLNFIVIPTNTQLKNNGRIEILDNLVSFKSFAIQDSIDQKLTLDGTVDYRDFSNPKYDLSLKTDGFQVMNSASHTNQTITGKLNLGIDLGIKGEQSNLKVTSDFVINDETNIVYVMPGKDLELITDEGVVEFVDFENQEIEELEISQKQFIGDSIAAQFEGIDINSTMEIDPGARFRIIVDPNSGDLTEFQLKGKLQYRFNETQRGNLTGLIEFENGFYDLSFYGLVKKRFSYDPGSTVVWSGDVMDGEINLSAQHTVRTNSVGLVSNEISSHERAMYNQRLPYDVTLTITEKISYPRITFGIDLPRRYRENYATLDSKLNILNQPNMESERNKQVFALLVGGTFIPENPDINEGSSSTNFATTAARNSINAIMTQQLNKLTGQFIPGLEMDMGLNTFDDYGSGQAQTKTQLDVKVSKNLFNDRVSAEMESHINLDGSVRQMGNQSTAGMTEFAVSYKLTRAGNYRIKAFSENAYDIFDGEIQNSGIAFIFVREFDSFKKKKGSTPSNAESIGKEPENPKHDKDSELKP